MDGSNPAVQHYRSKWTALCIALVVAGIYPVTAQADGIDVLDWELATAVQNSSGQTVQTNLVPQTPYTGSQTVFRAASVAQSIYAISYGEQLASFMITINHHCEHAGDFPRCISTGDAIVAATGDLLLTINGSIPYSFSSDHMTASSGVSVSLFTNGDLDPLFGVSDAADAFLIRRRAH